MKYELKHIFYSHDIDEFTSEVNFFTPVIIGIGVKDEDGADDFFANVTSLEGLAETCEQNQKIFRGEVLTLRGYLLLPSFNKELVEQKINNIILDCARENWEQTAIMLSRYFIWEFEDYKLKLDKS